MLSHAVRLVRNVEQVTAGLVELLEAPVAIHQREGQRAAVDHGAGLLGHGARARHVLCELQPAGDVRRDGGEILEIDEAEARRRRVGRGGDVAHHAHRSGGAGRGVERRDHGRPCGARGRRCGIAVGLEQHVVRDERLPRGRDAPRRARDGDGQPLHLGRPSDGGRDAEGLAIGVPQRDVGALRVHQARDALERVAQQQLAVGRREQPARQLDEEGAEATFALEAGAPCHHDGEVRGDFEEGPELVERARGGRAHDRHVDAPALGIVRLDAQRVAGRGVGPRADGAALAQAAVREAHLRTARPFADDSGGALPEDFGFLRGARF